MNARALLHVLLAVAVLAAVPLAFAQDPAQATSPSTTAPSAPASGATGASEAPGASASPPAQPMPTMPLSMTGGLAPLPNDQHVPSKLLPPGTFEPDTGPSTVIYPVQTLTVRFNHKLHVGKDVGATCRTCHAAAYGSGSVSDRLLPSPLVCDSCHKSDHSDMNKVVAGPATTPNGQCAFCHNGYKPSDGNAVAKMVMPRANMVFNHKKHVDRNIGCAQCHGAVQELELSTRDQLPRMRGCFGCHQMPDSAARGDAKSACETCHVRGQGGEAGRMKTMFASGVLMPPRWLHNAAHTPDFIERHKFVAGNDSQFCANCHSENYCTACHDGRVRPRSIHPNDYLSMHPIEARQASQKCTSCHREQSFCLGCHQRAGVSMTGPTGAKDSGRFHPAKMVWSDAPRKPGHHAYEAERNINACVSCHVERDCVICHGAQGIGGGFNPHKNGFAGGCSTQFRRNPRPCFVCHDPGSARLAQCR